MSDTFSGAPSRCGGRGGQEFASRGTAPVLVAFALTASAYSTLCCLPSSRCLAKVPIVSKSNSRALRLHRWMNKTTRATSDMKSPKTHSNVLSCLLPSSCELSLLLPGYACATVKNLENASYAVAPAAGASATASIGP
jgi:hypothetical protein